jgi:hypothetical protein
MNTKQELSKFRQRIGIDQEAEITIYRDKVWEWDDGIIYTAFGIIFQSQTWKCTFWKSWWWLYFISAGGFSNDLKNFLYSREPGACGMKNMDIPRHMTTKAHLRCLSGDLCGLILFSGCISAIIQQSWNPPLKVALYPLWIVGMARLECANLATTVLLCKFASWILTQTIWRYYLSLKVDIKDTEIQLVTPILQLIHPNTPIILVTCNIF